MGILELFFIAVGLSMDAFAVSICKGLSARKLCWKHYLVTGAWFGGFQALMPTIGYFLGSTFEQYITAFDHWVAFVLLAFIGGNMLREGFSKGVEKRDASFDALAVGITFALLPDVNIIEAAILIGITTCVLSVAGLKIGNIFGAKYKSRAQIAGGVILIVMGLKILLEHLGLIHF